MSLIRSHLHFTCFIYLFAIMSLVFMISGDSNGKSDNKKKVKGNMR